MLGIGKIRPGRETYHLDAVADGVEDYYFAPHEAPGVWLGGGVSSLGLQGQVNRDQLVALLAGDDPTSGEPLARGRASRGDAARLPGYDVTLRAPKSVSLLWALTSHDAVRAQLQAGHDAAVAATLEHLEHVAAEARRGRNGSVRMPTTGFVAAAFRHRTSRAGDPVLHTHLVIPNVVRGVDGRWSAPNGTMLYANAKSSGYLYQAILRGELTRRLGVAWGPVHHGAADLVGTSAEVIRAFSRRRVEIEERRDAIAARSARQLQSSNALATIVTAEQVATERAARIQHAGATGQLAALETRRAKTQDFDMHSAVLEWRERATRLGYGDTAWRAQLGVQRPTLITDHDRVMLAARLVGEAPAVDGDKQVAAHHLCARASTWSRRDALMGWCSQLQQGTLDLAELDDLTDTFLHSHPAVIRADGQPGLRPGDGIRLANGGFVPARDDVVRYTTRRMRAVEEQLVASATTRTNDRVGTAEPVAVAAAINAHASVHGSPLTPGQRAMVTALTNSGRGVEVVVGRAGTGKTTALAVARSAWQGSGHRVHGAAKAAVAARHLELATGIPSQTLDSFLADARRDAVRLPGGAVLVLDEAATTETPLLAELLARARVQRWKVVLVGDDQQLAEIDAGGGFRALRERLGAHVLSDNVRQHEAWERDAIDLVRRGQAVEALTTYIEHSRVAITDTREGAYRLMVGRWWRRRIDGASELLQAHRNADVRALNQLIHDRRVNVGEVGAETLHLGVDIGIGDRVLTRLPARSANIVNGMRGEVVQLETSPGSESVTLRLDDGSTRRLDAGYLSRTTDDGLPALDLAYATTIHRNQGITAERSQVLIDPGLTADAAYVALSRGRACNELVLAAAPHGRGEDVSHWEEDASPRRALANCLRVFERRPAKRLSIDSVEIPSASPEAAARRQDLDDLLAAWGRSMGYRRGDAPADASASSATAAPLEPTDDPHLLAIEELLAAPRAEVVDAVARYRAQLRVLARKKDDEESQESDEHPWPNALRTHARTRLAGGAISTDDEPSPDVHGSAGPALRGPRLC